jgi:hypothetical protein
MKVALAQTAAKMHHTRIRERERIGIRKIEIEIEERKPGHSGASRDLQTSDRRKQREYHKLARADTDINAANRDSCKQIDRPRKHRGTQTGIERELCCVNVILFYLMLSLRCVL